MIINSALSRRSVILGLAVLLLGAKQGTSLDPEIIIEITRQFAQSPGTVSLGRKYLHKFPNENNRDQLIAEFIKFKCTDVLQLSNLIKEDFKAENTIIIDGWVLSKTEAKLYALASML